MPYEVVQANSDASGKLTTIGFDPTVFATAQSIQLVDSLDLNNTSVGTIIGIIAPPSGLTLIGGKNIGMNFTVVAVEANTSVLLSGLTITDGNAMTSSGGGITNAGTLALSNCLLSDNVATEGAHQEFRHRDDEQLHP